MRDELVQLSKKMSYLLRHNPGAANLDLDSSGWVDFDAFVAALQDESSSLTRDDIVDVIEQNDKQRFELYGGRIRAAQGHSIHVDLDLAPVTPPNVLWHGTVERFLDSIAENGLIAKGRTHVHLSDTIEGAREVGRRRGEPVVLEVDAKAMVKAGVTFFRSANGVWLTASVDASFLLPAS